MDFSGWLDDSNPIVARISKRIELITGLSTTLRKEASDAEKFQVQLISHRNKHKLCRSLIMVWPVNTTSILISIQSQRQENPNITLKLYVMQSGGPTEPNLPLRNSGERVATFMIYVRLLFTTS